MAGEYTAVKVPNEVADRIRVLAAQRYNGYRSMSEIATDQLRRFIQAVDNAEA